MKLYYVAANKIDAKNTTDIVSTIKEARRIKKRRGFMYHIYKADSFQPKYKRTYEKNRVGEI
jgi:hypothetical protein